MKKNNEFRCSLDGTEFPRDIQINNSLLSQNEIANESKFQEEVKLKTLQIISSQMEHLTESFDFKFEMATIGSVSTGKTCLFNRFFKDFFDSTEITLNFNIFTKTFKIEGNSVFITAFDTSGEEKFRSMTKNYIQNKHCVLYVFSVAELKSFEQLDSWYEWSEQNLDPNTIQVLVGTQIDKTR